MEVIKAKIVKTINWTETLRKMPVGSFIECTIEEKDNSAPRASYLKKNEGQEYAFKKNPETKMYTITRIK